MRFLIHLCLLPGFFLASSATLTNLTRTGNVACDALIFSGLRSIILLATDDGYKDRIESYWSASARLHPWCIAQPRTVDQVSQTLTTLLDANSGAGDWHIAVRGGGHNQWAGSNNVQNGVTIDLGFFNQTTYNEANGLVSVGPGGKWGAVFAEINAKYGVTVAGGRDGDVGVGGFLLGGGNSYYTGRYGFGCDSVRNFEVILADGSIVDANNETNSDLYKALKGGGGNFGIVTRFDMEALSYTELYGGSVMWATEYTEDVIDALATFATLPKATADDAIVILWVYNAAIGSEVAIASSLVNIQGVTNSTSFAKFDQIPSLSDGRAIVELGPYVDAGVAAAGLYVWYTLTLKANPAIIRHAVQLHADLVVELKDVFGPENFTSEVVFQPLPTYFNNAIARQGGNMLGLDSTLTDNGILFLLEVNTYTAENEAPAHAYASKLVAKVEDYATSVGGNLAWRYLNYADPSQDVLSSYGASNVAYMKHVAEKYDPAEVFQKRIPGGFKISKIR